MDCVVNKIKSLTTAPNKRVEGAGILWVKRGDVINGLDEGKRIDRVFLISVRRGSIFGLDKSLRVAHGLIAGLGAKNSTNVPNKRVKDAGIPWAKREDVIDRLNKDKKIDVICSTGIERRIIFRPDKSLRVVGKLMARLGASAALDKKVRLDANYLPDRSRSLFSKTEKGSKGTCGLDGRGNILVTIMEKRKGGVSRPRASKGCWITGLEKTIIDLDNLGDSTMLLAQRFLAWLITIEQQIPYVLFGFSDLLYVFVLVEHQVLPAYLNQDRINIIQ